VIICEHCGSRVQALLKCPNCGANLPMPTKAHLTSEPNLDAPKASVPKARITMREAITHPSRLVAQINNEMPRRWKIITIGFTAVLLLGGFLNLIGYESEQTKFEDQCEETGGQYEVFESRLDDGYTTITEGPRSGYCGK
jgi:hypothetical protein